jgi:hypothetical protein
MGIEKRKLHRRHIIYYLQLVEPTHEQVIGYLVDITVFGMMMVSQQALETGQKMTLRIMLPEELGKGESVTVQGASVWCHKDVNPDYFAIGFKFDQLSSETVEAIIELIKEMAFNN